MNGGQGSSLWNWFSLPIFMWLPRIELRLSGLHRESASVLYPLSPLVNPSLFLRQDLHWTWSTSIELGWPVSSWDPPASCPLSTGLTDAVACPYPISTGVTNTVAMPGFLRWCWVPQSCIFMFEHRELYRLSHAPKWWFIFLFVLTEFVVVVSFRYLKIPLGSDSDNIPL